MSKPRRSCDIILGFADYAQTRGGLKTLMGQLSPMAPSNAAESSLMMLVFKVVAALRPHSPPAHQFLPMAAQRPLDAPNGGQQNVDAPGLDFLDSSGIQVDHFRQPLLGDVLPHPLAAHVRPKAFQLLSLLRINWHALLRRILALTNTAQWGVIRCLSKAHVLTMHISLHPALSCSHERQMEGIK